jgi:hypothetical protein
MSAAGARLTLYRDPLAGLRSQVATKRAAAADRDRRLPPIVRALLPERLREALATPEPKTEADPEAQDLAALTALDAALEQLISAQDEALAMAPKVRDCPYEVRDFPPPDPPPPWLIEEDNLLIFRALVNAHLEAIAADAWLVRWGDAGYLSRLRMEHAPLVWRVQGGVGGEPFLPVKSFKSTLRSSVPSGLGALDVRCERIHHAVGRALSVATELTVGDEAFDAAFWITGDAVTSTLLDGRVRRHLLWLQSCSPVLYVGGGLVELSWWGILPAAANFVLPRAAVDVVLGLRAALEHG